METEKVFHLAFSRSTVYSEYINDCIKFFLNLNEQYMKSIYNYNNILIYINPDMFRASLTNLSLLLCFFHCSCCSLLLAFVRFAIFSMTIKFQYQGFFKFCNNCPFYCVLHLPVCSLYTSRRKYCFSLLKFREKLIVLTLLNLKMTNCPITHQS